MASRPQMQPRAAADSHSSRWAGLLTSPLQNLIPGPRGDGGLQRRVKEPGQHRQVPEQPQDHGHHQQVEFKVWCPTATVDGGRGGEEPGAATPSSGEGDARFFKGCSRPE